MGTMATRLNDHFKATEQVQPEDEDEEEFVAFDEAPSARHVINMFQCATTTQKTTIKKDSSSDFLIPKYNNR